jgi:heme/copper-type cytochrome/quinol oxidase subunit 2
MTQVSFFDYPRSWQFLFQKPATTMMEGIIDLHHDIFTFLIIIITFVSVMLIVILTNFSEKYMLGVTFLNFNNFMRYQIKEGFTHHTNLEIIWTLIPTFILLVIATPSFALIYALDEIIEPQVTFRAIGHQWYWTYEFPDNLFFNFTNRQTNLFSSNPIMDVSTHIINNTGRVTDIVNKIHSMRTTLIKINSALKDVVLRFPIPGFSFNSYIIATEDLFPGSFRLLEVTHRLVLPVLTNIRILVTSYDVIHSWTVPSFGLKVDAVPGRLNEYFLNIHFLGLFYGQCSEICGVNHGFMPIKVEVTTTSLYQWWYLETSLLENNSLPFYR